MADLYTTLLRLIDQLTGSNSSTWGDKADTNFSLIEQAIAGYSAIAVTGGTTVLTATDGGTDQARLAILKFTGTLVSNQIIQIPAKSKIYVIWDGTTRAGYTFSVKTSGGTAITISSTGAKTLIFCDGTDCYQVSPEILNAAMDCNDKVVSKGEAKDWSASVNALGNTTGTVGTGAINYETAHIVTATFTGNVTIANDSIGNWPTSGKFGVIRMIITQDGTGSRTLTLGSAFKKAGGSLVLSTSAAAKDILEFSTIDGGATIYATVVKNYA